MLSPILNVMTKAAMDSGRILRHDFGEVAQLQASPKGPWKFANVTRRRVCDAVYNVLAKAFSRYDFFFGLDKWQSNPRYLRDDENTTTQSYTHSSRAPPFFVIDSLDGFVNFSHGLPHFALSMGLQDGGYTVAAVVYNPFTDELFVAERGKGAYLNNQRLRVSSKRKIEDCLVGYTIQTNVLTRNKKLQEWWDLCSAHLLQHVSGMLCMGSLALDLAYVASGRFDACIDFGLASFSAFPGMLIVSEAGGSLFSQPIQEDGDEEETKNHERECIDLNPPIWTITCCHSHIRDIIKNYHIENK